MPVRFTRGLSRRPPEAPPGSEDLVRHVRMVSEEMERKIEDLADQVPGSRFDERTVKSLGEGIEIRVANDLGYVPNRRVVVCERYPYRIGDSRDELADERFIYLKSDAPAGTPFTVRSI